MSHRPKMPARGSRKWARIAHHKSTHHQARKLRADPVFAMQWLDRWLNLRSAPNPRWHV